MEFETEAQKACYDKIVPWMQELFEDFLVASEEEPRFSINFGSAIAYTQVVPWGEEDAIIMTRSFVVMDIKMTPELMYYLLRENNSLYFGGFSLDGDEDIVFEHNLIGSTCDKEELKTSVITVVKFADEYDDEIVARWGGQRALDRWLKKILQE